MRPYSLLAAAAWLAFTYLAHADTLVEHFTVDDTGTGVEGVRLLSSPFQDFDPTLGTLQSVSVSLSGTAVATSNSSVTFSNVTDSIAQILALGQGQ